MRQREEEGVAPLTDRSVAAVGARATPSSPRNPRLLGVLARWGVGCGLLAALASFLDVRAVAGAFAKANPGDLLAGLLLILAIRVLQAWQVTLGLRTHGLSVGLWRAFVVNTIAMFYGIFFPGGVVGGVVKWYRLSKDNGRPADVLGALLFLRLVNTGFTLVCGIIAATVDEPLGMRNVWWVALALASGLVVIYGLLSTQVSAWLEARLLCARGKLATFAWGGLRDVLRALQQYRNLQARAAFAILSVPVLTQLLGTLVYFLAARALGHSLPVLTWIWILSLVHIIQLVPASISGLGLREGALVLLLPRYGIPAADALAFSIVIFGYTVLVGLFGGVLEVRELASKASKKEVEATGMRE